MIQMFCETVLGIDRRLVFQAIRENLSGSGITSVDELGPKRMKKLALSLKAHFSKRLRHGGVPDDPEQQLRAAIEAVFASWNRPRAITFRKLYKIAEDQGIAVTVQSMVFGNLNARSATGIMTTRDPNTGEKVFYGEYLPNAQGEDVLSGKRIPRPLREM